MSELPRQRSVDVDWSLVRCPSCGLMADRDMGHLLDEPVFCNGVSYTMPRSSMEFERDTDHPSTHEPCEMEMWTVVSARKEHA